MRYMTDDGESFIAKDAETFVRKLRQMSNSSTRDDAEYMREVANLAKMQNENWKVPTDNAEHFMSALLRYGMVKEETEK